MGKNIQTSTTNYYLAVSDSDTFLIPENCSTTIEVQNTSNEALDSGNYWTAITNTMPTAVSNMASAGIQTAALSVAGINSTPAIVATTQLFNIGVWSTGTAYSFSGSKMAAIGIQSSALVFGGENSSAVVNTAQKYTSGSWSSTGSLTQQRSELSGSGIQGAGLAIGGNISFVGTSTVGTTEKFNGTTWAITGYLNTNRCRAASAGTQNSALIVGGENAGAFVSSVEKFNGTAWSLITTFYLQAKGLSSSGTQNASLFFGGDNSGVSVGDTYKYNGNTFVSQNPLLVARRYLGGCGTQNTASAFGGLDVSSPNNTLEKFNGLFLPIPKISGYFTDINLTNSKTANSYKAETNIPAIIECEDSPYADIAELEDGLTELQKTTNDSYAWNVSASPNINKVGGAGAGTKNAAIIFGRESTSPSAKTSGEKFDGVTFSYSSQLLLDSSSGSSSGIQNSCLYIGGYLLNSTSNRINSVQKFNGISWSATTSLNVAKYSTAACGPKNATLLIGGSSSTVPFACLSETEKFNGTTWTSGPNLNTARLSSAAIGSTYNAAVAIGGATNGGSFSIQMEKFNGAVWSNAGNILNVYGLSATGSPNNGLIFGGVSSSGPVTNISQRYDGVTVSVTSSLNVARFGASAGTQNSSLIVTSTSEVFGCRMLGQANAVTVSATNYKNGLITRYF